MPVIGTGSVDPVPQRSYAYEAVGILGIGSILIILLATKVYAISSWAPEWQDYVELLVALFSAQLVVLWHANKVRGFVYQERTPKHLINRRLVMTFVITVICPIVFGVFWWGWLNVAAKGSVYAAFIVAPIFGTFPYHCSSLLFLMARRLNWYDAERVPELASDGMPDSYFETSGAIGVACAAALFTIYATDSALLDTIVKESSKWLHFVANESGKSGR